jgi:hypothetical protein
MSHTPPLTSSSTQTPNTPPREKMPRLHQKVEEVASAVLEDLLPDWPVEVVSSGQPTPQAPKKAKWSTAQSPYEKQYGKLSSGFFVYQGSKFKTSHLASGTYSSVYQITEGPCELTPGMSNASLVIKCFHGKAGAGFREHGLNNYFLYSVQNYHDIVALRLNVAPIYNDPLTDHVVIQRKIARPINPLDPEQLSQVKGFFDASIHNHVPMDLQPQNLREENGTVYLIDFLEESDEISVHLHKSLQAWEQLLCRYKVPKAEITLKLRNLAGACIEHPRYFTTSIQQLIGSP